MLGCSFTDTAPGTFVSTTQAPYITYIEREVHANVHHTCTNTHGKVAGMKDAG